MATAFTIFPELATELQDLIWEAAATHHQPRTFNIRSPTSRYPEMLRPVPWSIAKHNLGLSPLAMFSVCQNSRKIAMKHFKLSFAGIDNSPVWINFQTDILSIDGGLLSCIEIRHASFRCRINFVDLASVVQEFAQVEQLIEFSLAPRYHRIRQSRQAGRYKPFLSLKRLGDKQGDTPLRWLELE